MKILIACEESQTVCKAFREKGHDSYSCDTQDCSGGHEEWHIRESVIPLLNGKCSFQTMDGQLHSIESQWDMIIAFPPCTYLTSAGTRWFSPKCNSLEKIAEREILRKEAYDFFMAIANAECDKIIIENPVGYMNSHYRKPNQIIHPYYFGEPVQKRTCLWLKGVPLLEYTNVLEKPEPVYVKKNGERLNWVESLSKKDRQKVRSKTFESIAKAMADQYG